MYFGSFEHQLYACGQVWVCPCLSVSWGIHTSVGYSGDWERLTPQSNHIVLSSVAKNCTAFVHTAIRLSGRAHLHAFVRFCTDRSTCVYACMCVCMYFRASVCASVLNYRQCILLSVTASLGYYFLNGQINEPMQ